MLDEVEVKEKKLAPIEAQTKIYGGASKTINVAGEPGLENLLHPLQLIQGRVAGVIVSGSGLNWSVKIRGFRSVSGGSENPVILVNSVQVDISTLNSLPVRDIESVDVFKGPEAAIFGAQGMFGAIAFYTKKGNGVPPPTEGVYTLYQSGYHIPQQFYTPKYDVKRPEHERFDYRTTLLWSPVIVTDSTGRASVSFYNPDQETTVTGIIEGISITGTPGSSQLQYTIRK